MLKSWFIELYDYNFVIYLKNVIVLVDDYIINQSVRLHAPS